MATEIAAQPKEPEDKKGPDKWEIENWARTIMEAEEIKGDSEKMALVRPMLEKKAAGAQRAVKSISELREIAKEKTAQEAPDDE